MISNTKYVTLHVMIHSVYKDTQAIRNSDLVVLPLTRPLRSSLTRGYTQKEQEMGGYLLFTQRVFYYA